MSSNIESTLRVALMVALLVAADGTSAGAQPATDPAPGPSAPGPSVPGITVTPGGPPRGARPQPLVPDARDGASQHNRDSGEPQRIHPHGGCQYNQQPLELIV